MKKTLADQVHIDLDLIIENQESKRTTRLQILKSIAAINVPRVFMLGTSMSSTNIT